MKIPNEFSDKKSVVKMQLKAHRKILWNIFSDLTIILHSQPDLKTRKAKKWCKNLKLQGKNCLLKVLRWNKFIELSRSPRPSHFWNLGIIDVDN